MGRIWGSPDVGLGEPFISVFLPGLLMRLLPRSIPRLLGFNLRRRSSKPRIVLRYHRGCCSFRILRKVSLEVDGG